MDGRTGPAGKPGMAVDRSAHWHLGYGFPGGTSGISTAHAQGRPGDSASSQGVRRQEVCRCRLNRNVARQTTVFPWFYLTAIVTPSGLGPQPPTFIPTASLSPEGMFMGNLMFTCITPDTHPGAAPA